MTRAITRESGARKDTKMTELEALAKRLSEAQRKALMVMPEPDIMVTVRQGPVTIVPCLTAREWGASGNTLMAMYGLGGVDEATGELGPILVCCEWGEGGRRYWQATDLGIALRAHLLAQSPAASLRAIAGTSQEQEG
jgi:hypothetical protein